MRFGSGVAEFDLTDAGLVDRLDDILDVAVGVLEDHGPDHGNTRIERLARWVLFNVGEVPSLPRCAELATKCGIVVWSTDSGVLATCDRHLMPPADARYFAMMVLRAAMRAED